MSKEMKVGIAAAVGEAAQVQVTFDIEDGADKLTIAKMIDKVKMATEIVRARTDLVLAKGRLEAAKKNYDALLDVIGDLSSKKNPSYPDRTALERNIKDKARHVETIREAEAEVKKYASMVASLDK